VDQPGGSSPSDRIRDAVLDALRRVGPPEASFERTVTAPASDDAGGGERT